MNDTPGAKSVNIIETILIVFLLLALLVALYSVLHFFFGILTFALVFAISFERFFEWMVSRLKNKRRLAAVVYSLLLITLVALPLGFLFGSLSRNARPAVAWIYNVRDNGLPPLPASIARIPVAGKEIARLWDTYHDDPKQIIADHEAGMQELSNKVMTSGFNILLTLLEVIIGIIISALLLTRKSQLIAALQLPLEHLLGKSSAVGLLQAITMAIKGVSIGVMGTALIGATLTFIGLQLAGVSFAIGLSALVFFLVVIQVGPLPMFIPLILFMATQDRPGTVIFLIILGIVITIIDTIIKPILIGKSGGTLPFLVLFLGVVGGLAAWGFTGMFKGAIIVAVFYTVYNTWLGNKNNIRALK